MTSKFKITKSWFLLQKKIIIAHGLIILVFILFLTLFSSSIFNRIGGKLEAERQDFLLPEQTGNIQLSLNKPLVGNNFIQIEGWAYIDGQNAQDNQTYVVLKSSNQTYIFDTLLLF